MSSELITYINELSEPEAALDDIKQKPYAIELLQPKAPNFEHLAIEQLGDVLKTAIFINSHVTEIVDEFAWKLGESEEIASKFVMYDSTTRKYIPKPDMPGYILQALESKIGHKQPFNYIELSMRYKKPNLHLAAKCGNVRLFMHWLLKDEHIPSYVFIAASQHPQVFAAVYGKGQPKIPKKCYIEDLMPHIHLDVYKQLVEMKGFYTSSHVKPAVLADRIDILEFMVDEKEAPFELVTENMSLKSCQLAFSKFGDCKEFRTHMEKLTRRAASYKSDVLRYIHSQGIPISKPVLTRTVALCRDNVELYKLVYPGDSKIPPDDINRCIRNESVQCLEYILYKGVKMTVSDVREACASGNPRLLRVILDNVHKVYGLKLGLEFAIRKLGKFPEDRSKHLECINMLVAKIRSFRKGMLCLQCRTNKHLRFCPGCRVTTFCSEKCQEEARYMHATACKARTIPAV